MHRDRDRETGDIGLELFHLSLGRVGKGKAFSNLSYICELLSDFCNILIPFPHLILRESSGVSL